jgi:hypothetical protein
MSEAAMTIAGELREFIAKGTPIGELLKSAGVSALLDALDAAQERERRMREALAKAAEQFEFYGREHRKKERASTFNGIEVFAADSRRKAETNEQFAAMCRAALGEPNA